MRPFFRSRRPCTIFPFVVIPLPRDKRSFPAGSLSSKVIKTNITRRTFFHRIPTFFFNYLAMTIITIFITISSVIIAQQFMLSLGALYAVSLAVYFGSFEGIITS